MNKTDQLEKDFPYLFEHCYCGCGDGWYNILLSLCETLQRVSPNTKFDQIKEKFGALRVYIDQGNNAAYEAINNAEKLSYKICEYCGNTENVTTEGKWLKTLCEKCRR